MTENVYLTDPIIVTSKSKKPTILIKRAKIKEASINEEVKVNDLEKLQKVKRQLEIEAHFLNGKKRFLKKRIKIVKAKIEFSELKNKIIEKRKFFQKRTTFTKKHTTTNFVNEEPSILTLRKKL